MPFPFLRRQPDLRRFAEHVAAHAVAMGFGDRPEVRHAERAIVLGGGKIMFLDNLYREYVGTPVWRRNRLVRDFIAAMALAPAEPTTREQALAQLMPAVRDLGYVAAVAAAPGLPGKGDLDVPCRPLAGRYLLQPVLDGPTTIQSVTTKALAGFGLTVETALERAKRNLQAIDSPFVALAPRVWASRHGDGYDAARILLVDRIRRLTDSGPPLAVPVHRDLLLICDGDDVGAIAALARLAEEHAAEGRPVGLFPLRLQGDAWEPVAGELLDRHTGLQRLTTSAWVQVYGEQQTILQKQLGEDVHVATCSGMEDAATKRCHTYCTWIRDVPGVLPRTDRIVLLDGPKPAVIHAYRWEDLMARCGQHLRQRGDQPPRWDTVGFPDADTLGGIAPIESHRPS